MTIQANSVPASKPPSPQQTERSPVVLTPVRTTQTVMTRTGRSTPSHGSSHKERSIFPTAVLSTTLLTRPSALTCHLSSVSTKWLTAALCFLVSVFPRSGPSDQEMAQAFSSVCM